MFLFLPWFLLAFSPPMQGGVRLTPPAPISRAEPQFTELARDAGFQGDVLVQVVVNADGDVTDPNVAKKVGMGLDEEAIAAARQWKFKAATKDGQPVSVFAQIDVIFRHTPIDSSWMAAAMRSSDHAAQTRVGKAYYWGQNVAQNYMAALNWFQRAAAQDDARAESYLGMMYSQGQGVNKDSTEAARWLQKAAEQDDVVGQLYFGKACMDGDGVPIDFVQAYQWFTLAKRGQAAQAASLLDQLRSKMKPSEIEAAQALLRDFKPKAPSR
jgi:TonB family protein